MKRTVEGDNLPLRGYTRQAKLGEGGESCDFSLGAIEKTSPLQKVKACQAMEMR